MTTDTQAIITLGRFLSQNYPEYSVDDVVLGSRGSIYCLKPCTRGLGRPTCSTHRHFHAISIQGVGQEAYRDGYGRFISPYRLWNELSASGMRSMSYQEWLDYRYSYSG